MIAATLIAAPRRSVRARPAPDAPTYTRRNDAVASPRLTRDPYRTSEHQNRNEYVLIFSSLVFWRCSKSQNSENPINYYPDTQMVRMVPSKRAFSLLDEAEILDFWPRNSICLPGEGGMGTR